VQSVPRLGLGCAWRVELGPWLERSPSLQFLELHAEGLSTLETYNADDPLPDSMQRLLDRGVPAVLHSVTLNLGGAARPSAERLAAFARAAERIKAPLMGDHLCFVRAGGLESGHLLPLPRTRSALEIAVENVKIAKDSLPCAFAVENVASTFQWPERDNELDEAAFLSEVLERTDTLLLLDLANLVVNMHNHGWAPEKILDRLPLERIAYVHMAGGTIEDGLAVDSHAHPLWKRALELLEELSARVEPNGYLIERDDRFDSYSEQDLNRELDSVAAAVGRGASRRRAGSPVPLEGSHAGHVLRS
jgi:uncharacterized protein (UPF0276 family)